MAKRLTMVEIDATPRMNNDVSMGDDFLKKTGAEEPYEKLKGALRAEIDEAAWSALYSTTSRPFDPPETGKIAVKVINHYGDEVLKVYDLRVHSARVVKAARPCLNERSCPRSAIRKMSITDCRRKAISPDMPPAAGGPSAPWSRPRRGGGSRLARPRRPPRPRPVRSQSSWESDARGRPCVARR
jgi:hypothetical protein